MFTLAFQATLLRTINAEPIKEDLFFWTELVELKNTVSSTDDPVQLLEASKKYAAHLRRAIELRVQLYNLVESALDAKNKLEILTVLRAMRIMRLELTESQISILCDFAKSAEDHTQIPILEYLLDSSKAVDRIPLIHSFCENSSPAVRLYAAKIICKNAISKLSKSLDEVYARGGSYTEFLSPDFAVTRHVQDEILLACGDSHFSTEILLRESSLLRNQDTSASRTLVACYFICNVENTSSSSACRTLAAIASDNLHPLQSVALKLYLRSRLVNRESRIQALIDGANSAQAAVSESAIRSVPKLVDGSEESDAWIASVVNSVNDEQFAILTRELEHINLHPAIIVELEKRIVSLQGVKSYFTSRIAFTSLIRNREGITKPELSGLLLKIRDTTNNELVKNEAVSSLRSVADGARDAIEEISGLESSLEKNSD